MVGTGNGGSLRASPQLSTLLHPSRRWSLNSPAPSFLPPWSPHHPGHLQARAHWPLPGPWLSPKQSSCRPQHSVVKRVCRDWGTLGDGGRGRKKGTGQWDPLPYVNLPVAPSVPDTGGERQRLSGELNSMPGLGTMNVRVSSPQPILNRGRPDNKVTLSPHPKNRLPPLGPLMLLPVLTPLSAPQD